MLVVTRERLDWFRALLMSYESEHDWGKDPAVLESLDMMMGARALLEDLEAMLPAGLPLTLRVPKEPPVIRFNVPRSLKR